MGFWTRAVVGKWLARWLLRGGPLQIAAKLLAVGALGAWKYRRELKRAEAEDPRRIDADYEVLEPDRIRPADGASRTRRPLEEPEPASPRPGSEIPTDEEPPRST